MASSNAEEIALESDDDASESGSGGGVATSGAVGGSSTRSALQQRLFEARLRANEARKANHAEVIEENKRKRTDASAEARQRHFERRAKAEEAAKEAAARGIDAERARALNVSVAAAERQTRRNKKQYFHWDRFNDEAHFRAHEKQVAALDKDKKRAAAAAAASGSSTAAARVEEREAAAAAAVAASSVATLPLDEALDPYGPGSLPPGTLHVPSEKVLNRFVDSLHAKACLLYTSPSPRDMRRSRMPSSA
eukprot:TRINITY_DN1172_c0_g1_i2.p1 TRINITY_DN1172_c0_g1~~TRINITY_DN1172_c0_g1_i2.p1  ORF type:complete len:251 (-),score=133.96 TRINITY_DN1172_c0_g1_i2:16-768(-)